MVGRLAPPVEKLGEDIHDDVALVWTDILKKGMEEEEINELRRKYPPMANCRLVEAPKLNIEVKKAITPQHQERDERLARVQNQVGAAMGAVGKALTSCLKEEGEGHSQLIELLGDAGKLLASVHFAESQSRRILASSGVNKNFKSTLSEVSVDGWLFGDNLSERMRTTKALDKTSEDLKIQKPKGKNKPIKKHYNLNSRSLPRNYSYQSRGRQSQPRKKQTETGRETRTREHNKTGHRFYRSKSEVPMRRF